MNQAETVRENPAPISFKRSTSTGAGYSLLASIPKRASGPRKFKHSPQISKRHTNRLLGKPTKRLKSRGLSEPITARVEAALGRAVAQRNEIRKTKNKSKRSRKKALARVNALVTARPAPRLRQRTVRRLASKAELKTKRAELKRAERELANLEAAQ